MYTQLRKLALLLSLAALVTGCGILDRHLAVQSRMDSTQVDTPARGTTGLPGDTLAARAAFPVVQWKAATYTVAENAVKLTLTAVIDKAPSRDLGVPILLSGSATNPQDYTPSATSLFFLAGATEASIDLNIVNDALFENDENVVVTLGRARKVAIGTIAATTVTVQSDDAMPSVQWELAAQTVREDAGTAMVVARLSAVSGVGVSLPYTLSGTAAAGADYTLAAGTLNIPAGSASAALNVPIVNDTADEDDEALVLTFGTPTGATLGANTIHTLTIGDDDMPPTVQFTVASQSLSEGGGNATVNLSLSAASSKVVTVPFALSGTATAGTDYTLAAGTVTIAAGTAAQTITFPIIDDALVESDETVILTLGTPTNATLGAVKAHALTIIENDMAPPPTIAWMTAAQTVQESAGTVTVTAALSAATTKIVTVPFTVSGTSSNPADHNLSNSMITIPVGATTGAVAFQVVDDTLDENDETLILTLGTPVNAVLGAQTVHTATIADNDAPPMIAFNVATQKVSETAGTVTVNLALSAVSGLNVTVPYAVSGTATAGTDYAGLTSSTATIPAGAKAATITFTVANDMAVEADETIILTLGAPTNASLGAITAHTVMITDPPIVPTIKWGTMAQTVNENAGTVTVTAMLSSTTTVPVSVPVTVSGTSTATADYVLSGLTGGILTIPAGTTSAAVTLAVVDDTLGEPAETAILTMGAPTGATLGAPSVYTLTITDNDTLPLLQWKTIAQAITKPSGTTPTSVTATVMLDNPSASAITVPYLVGGTATQGKGHDLKPGSITIPAGATAANLVFNALDDNITANDLSDPAAFHTVQILLGMPTGAALGLKATHTLTINNNDLIFPRVSWKESKLAVRENEGAAVTLTMLLDAPTTLLSVISYDLGAGTATAGTDFTLAAGSVTFNPGEVSKSITLAVLNDTAQEPDETVLPRIASRKATIPGGGSFSTSENTTLTVTIIDDDTAAGVVNWSLASQSVGEAGGMATVTALISQPRATDVTIPYIVAGNATRGTDYLLPANALTIPAGSTNFTLSIPIVDDTTFEQNETVTITFGTPPTGITIGSNKVHTLTILNDDPFPAIGFALPAQTVAESAGNVPVVVTTDRLAGFNIAPQITLGGTTIQSTDYNLSSPSGGIVAGATSATYTVAVINDTLYESSEVVALSLGCPSNTCLLGQPALHTLTITDNDAAPPAPVVQFAVASQGVSESAGKAVAKINLSAASTIPVEIPYEVTGTATGFQDHTLGSGVAIVPVGATTVDLSFNILDDRAIEPDETIIITLKASPAATLSATGPVVHMATIMDDDSTAPATGIDAFKVTVYALTRSKCIACHNTPPLLPGLPEHASDTLATAYDWAKNKAGPSGNRLTNFVNIPGSELVVHAGNGHCGATCAATATTQQEMIAAITAWAQVEVGGGGGGGGPLDVGTVGLLTFNQYPNYIYQAIGGLDPATKFKDQETYDGAIRNLSSQGNIADLSGPSMNSYIAVAGEHCQALVTEVSGTTVPDKRGFDQITGLNGFNITPAAYSDTMRRAVIQNFAQRFWGRPAADPAELGPLLTQITETLAGLATTTDTRNSAILTCTVIAASPRGIAN